MIRPTQKHRRIALVIVAGVLALILLKPLAHEPPVTQEVVQPAPRAPSHTANAAAVEPIADLALKHTRAKSPKGSSELFQPKSWYVPPPPPPPPPPAPPTAPPLPFAFIGKAENPDGTLTIFLSGNNRVYLIKGGETIDGIYHVDDTENGQLTLTYLPLHIQQHLSMGDAP